MIIIKTDGGLGNQLFQYAAALDIAKKSNDKVVFDLEFQKKDKRRFELKNLGVKEKLLPASYRKTITYQVQNFLLKFYRKYIAYKRWDKDIIRYFFGKAGVFFCDYNNPDIPFSFWGHNNVLLAGSFSNEKYFLSSIDDIRKETNRYAAKCLSEKNNTVCVHIRRGDYVGNIVHEVCTDSYYYRAMDEMERRVGKCVFMIFTDDIDYVKKRMNFSHPNIICEEKNTCKTLCYMIQCDHYIISNSTFSWWAQRLNLNDKKIVIAPERWFNTDERCDLYNETWIKMN